MVRRRMFGTAKLSVFAGNAANGSSRTRTNLFLFIWMEVTRRPSTLVLMSSNRVLTSCKVRKLRVARRGIELLLRS